MKEVAVTIKVKGLDENDDWNEEYHSIRIPRRIFEVGIESDSFVTNRSGDDIEKLAMIEITFTLFNEPLQTFGVESRNGSLIKALFDSMVGADVTLFFPNESVQLKAHSWILCLRSNYFDSVFKMTDSKEAKNGLIAVNETTVEVMRELLRFIYTDNINGLDKFAFELMLAADYYHVNDLVKACEDYLKANLTPENMIPILEFAVNANRPELKETTMRFFRENRTNMTRDLKTKGLLWKKTFDHLSSAAQEIVKYLLQEERQG